MKISKAHIASGSLMILLVVGIFFRFYNLTHKSFWLDEAKTALSISGFKRDRDQMFQPGQPVEAKDLLVFQQPRPDRNLLDSIDYLACESLPHAPLFIVLLYSWIHAFGSSVFTMRLLPALISLLQLPAAYWLCLELWGAPGIALIATVLLGLSPVQVAYAQEVREYSLYVVITLLTSASFLRAVRIQSIKAWIMYCTCMILALNTSVLATILAATQLTYIILRKGLSWSKTLKRFIAVQFVTMCTCMPWLILYGKHFDLGSGIASSPPGLTRLDLFKSWCINFSSSIFDMGHYWLKPVQALTALVLLFELYVLIFVWRRSKRASAFLLPTIAVNMLVLIALDLVFPTRFSVEVRFELPAMIAVLLCTAYTLTRNTSNKGNAHRAVWVILTFCVFALEIISCAISSQATTWREKNFKQHDLVKVAHILNQNPGVPLLVTESTDQANPSQFLCLSHLLRGEVKLEVLGEPALPALPVNTKHFFLYNPSPVLRSFIAGTGRFTLRTVDNMDYLVQVDPK
jgi:uncharacterized membrane protein